MRAGRGPGTGDARGRGGAAALAVAALVGIWLPFVWLSVWAYPALDDFTESRWSNLWAVQGERYAGYTGRVAGTFVQSLNPWHWESLLAYRATAALRILLLAVCLFVFARVVTRRFLAGGIREALVLYALFAAGLLAGLPAPSELFYWYSSSVLYLVPLCVLLLLTAALVDLRGSPTPSVRRDALLAVGFFYAAGNVEILPLLVLAIAGPALVFSLRRARQLIRPLSIVVVATLLGLTVNLLSPGNAVRQLQMGTAARTAEPLGFLGKLLFHVLEVAATWLINPWIVLPAVLAAPLFWALLRRGGRLPNPLVVATATFYSLVVLYAGPLWGIGFSIRRVENLGLLVFLLGLFGFVGATTAVALARLDGRSAAAAWAVVVLATGAVAGSITPSHEGNAIVVAYREWRDGVASAYAEAEIARARTVREYPAEDVVVPPLAVVSHTLVPFMRRLRVGGWDVLSERPEGWWANQVYARYYGKRSIRVEREGAADGALPEPAPRGREREPRADGGRP